MRPTDGRTNRVICKKTKVIYAKKEGLRIRSWKNERMTKDDSKGEEASQNGIARGKLASLCMIYRRSSLGGHSQIHTLGSARTWIWGDGEKNDT